MTKIDVGGWGTLTTADEYPDAAIIEFKGSWPPSYAEMEARRVVKRGEWLETPINQLPEKFRKRKRFLDRFGTKWERDLYNATRPWWN